MLREATSSNNSGRISSSRTRVDSESGAGCAGRCGAVVKITDVEHNQLAESWAYENM